tara:strand:- start:572 stop:769 length:198 start_codon:yes stop_codon:yes gene_type:complete
MQKSLEDSTVGLKLDGVIKDLYPDLSKEQVNDISYHVYHKMNIIPLYDQAKELIKQYVDEKISSI